MLPRAQQVADRFHLVQSLIRAVQDELAHRRDALRMPTQEIVGHNSQEGATIAVPEPEVLAPQQRGALPSSRPQEIRQKRWERKQESFAMVKGSASTRDQSLRNREADRAWPCDGGQMATLVGVPTAAQQEGATTRNGRVSERGVATFVGPRMSER